MFYGTPDSRQHSGHPLGVSHPTYIEMPAPMSGRRHIRRSPLFDPVRMGVEPPRILFLVADHLRAPAWIEIDAPLLWIATRCGTFYVNSTMFGGAVVVGVEGRNLASPRRNRSWGGCRASNRSCDENDRPGHPGFDVGLRIVFVHPRLESAPRVMSGAVNGAQGTSIRMATTWEGRIPPSPI